MSVDIGQLPNMSCQAVRIGMPPEVSLPSRQSAPDTTIVLCTLFDRLFLPQGLALYRSLERTAKRFVLHVLCMDNLTREALSRIELPHIRLIALDEIEDDALRAVKPSRTKGEYCWTCTAPLLELVQRLYPDDTVVGYVDADVSFFSSPAAILAELGRGSIFVHEHDFAPDHAHFLPVAGRFNVGVVGVRNNPEGRACLRRWREQCISECVLDPAAGKCGDQNYLNEWPALYRELVISANPGIGRAPWNIEKNTISRIDGQICVDAAPLIFYHYHVLRLCRPWLVFRPTMMARSSYRISTKAARWIYRPYILELWKALSDLKSVGMDITDSLHAPTWQELADAYRCDQLSLSVAI